MSTLLFCFLVQSRWRLQSEKAGWTHPDQWEGEGPAGGLQGGEAWAVQVPGASFSPPRATAFLAPQLRLP